jgi:hypothetical protein
METLKENLKKPELLIKLEEGFEIWRISPLLLKEQDKNARVQSSGTFKSLVRNVTKRKALESLPYVAKVGEDFWIMSGHHRVRAAITAKLETIVVLVDTAPLTRSEIRAKQIAHNAINGTDDPAVLLQLLDEIEDVQALLESAVSRDTLNKMAKPVVVPDVAVDYDFKVITFAFLPSHIRKLDAVCDALKGSDKVLTAELESHKAMAKALKALGKADDIRSMGAIVYRMVEIIMQYVDQKKGAEEEQSVKPPAE